MYNSEIPPRSELPTTAQLIKSTIVAFVAAVVILLTMVLPAEYAVDPTGIGRALGLAQMGEIKQQLAAEAAADHQRERQLQPPPGSPDRRSGLPGRIISWLFVSPAFADSPRLAQLPVRTDETVFTLKPNEGIEYKIALKQGQSVEYSWKADGGGVNFDMHGSVATGSKNEKSYKTGRAAAQDQGVLTARADGTHGWFWRNRGTKDVTVTLRTKGAYAEIRRVM